MKRFCGMMPSNEVEKEEHYEDKSHNSVIIQAGPHGWSVIWGDGSSTYNDVDATTEDNFNTAYAAATKRAGKLSGIEPVSERSERIYRER